MSPGLPCAIRDHLDNVHLADMQKEHLQDAKEHGDENGLDQLSTSPSHAFSRAALHYREGQKYFCADEMLQIQLEKQKCRRGLYVAAKGLGTWFRNAFVYTRLVICRHSPVLLFPCCRDEGMSWLQGRALACVIPARAWFPSVEASHDSKSALLPGTWVQTSACASGLKLSPLLSWKMR